MFKHYFEQVKGIETYPIISLLIFFIFFIGLSIYVFKMPQKEIKHLGHLPLED